MIKAGIVGGTGYTGIELLRLLSQHPQVELAAITSRQEAGTQVSAMFPSLRGRVSLAFSHPDKAPLKNCDVVFFATPNGVAMGEARALSDAGVRIVDISADFRIKDVAEWERWYKVKHAAPELLAEGDLLQVAERDGVLRLDPGLHDRGGVVLEPAVGVRHPGAVVVVHYVALAGRRILQHLRVERRSHHESQQRKDRACGHGA